MFDFKPVLRSLSNLLRSKDFTHREQIAPEQKCSRWATPHSGAKYPRGAKLCSGANTCSPWAGLAPEYFAQIEQSFAPEQITHREQFAPEQFAQFEQQKTCSDGANDAPQLLTVSKFACSDRANNALTEQIMFAPQLLTVRNCACFEMMWVMWNSTTKQRQHKTKPNHLNRTSSVY